MAKVSKENGAAIGAFATEAIRLIELHETAAKVAHELFAHECFGYTGEGREHSERCKNAVRIISDAFAK